MKRIVITSDLQIPYHNPRQVKAHINFIKAYQPDMVINIGDLTDFPEPSRWNKDTRLEFETSIEDHVETTKRVYFDPLRKVFDGRIGMHIGNHDKRPLDYKMRYAPALDKKDPTQDEYYYANLLDFDGYGIEDLGDYYSIARGWKSTHGHVGLRLSQVAGSTALAGTAKHECSLVMGHTHRLGLQSRTTGANGNERTYWGFEVGNMMDKSKADYITKKGGYANWQSGFGVIYEDGNIVTPVMVPMAKDGTFIFEGRKW